MKTTYLWSHGLSIPLTPRNTMFVQPRGRGCKVVQTSGVGRESHSSYDLFTVQSGRTVLDHDFQRMRMHCCTASGTLAYRISRALMIGIEEQAGALVDSTSTWDLQHGMQDRRSSLRKTSTCRSAAPSGCGVRVSSNGIDGRSCR